MLRTVILKDIKNQPNMNLKARKNKLYLVYRTASVRSWLLGVSSHCLEILHYKLSIMDQHPRDLVLGIAIFCFVPQHWIFQSCTLKSGSSFTQIKNNTVQI